MAKNARIKQGVPQGNYERLEHTRSDHYFISSNISILSVG